jgi:hypothetical protein
MDVDKNHNWLDNLNQNESLIIEKAANDFSTAVKDQLAIVDEIVIKQEVVYDENE